MRAIIILAVIALLMGLAGWLTFGHVPGRTSINIETDEIKRDTETAVENTEKVIESGVEVLKGDEPAVETDPADGLETDEPVQPAPVDVDKEPVRAAPTETPVTSPIATP
jgi:hypothetical protein